MRRFRGDAKILRVANRNRPKVAKIATIPNDEFVISIEYSGIMEATPTFALSNQFLVWVAKMVLAKCDIDLVLTEYYKERLESRLKIRETHLNENKLIEFTVLNTPNLPVPSDWTSTTKPLPTRLPCLLPTSPLSLCHYHLILINLYLLPPIAIVMLALFPSPLFQSLHFFP